MIDGILHHEEGGLDQISLRALQTEHLKFESLRSEVEQTTDRLRRLSAIIL